MGVNDKSPVVQVPRRKSSEIDVLVGHRIRLRRTLLGRTQADLAEQCFLSPQQVHKYEQGTSKMTAARLAQFGQALDVPVAWFFDEIDVRNQLPDDVLNLLSVPANVRMLALFDRIGDPALKQILLSTADALSRYDAGQSVETSSDYDEEPERAAKQAVGFNES